MLFRSAAQEPLPSLDWNAPPDTLNGLIALPNGMMAAFNGKDLMFCEPFRPHAWPEKYALTTDYPIVALGASGSSVYVLTTGMPYVVTGASPDTMQMERVEENTPCINARGVVDLGYGVAFPTHDGLAVASASGVKVISDQLFTRSEWQKMQPESMISGQFAGRYFSSYAYLESDGTPRQGTFIVDMSGATPFLLRARMKADCMWYDLPNGALYSLIGAEVYEWDALGQGNETLTWRSKQFIVPKPTNFGAIRLDASASRTPEEQAAYDQQIADMLAFNTARFAEASIQGEVNGAAVNLFPVNGDVLNRLDDKPFVSVNIYADFKLVANVSTMNRVARLPAGFLATVWEIEVNSNTSISEINLAGSAHELALV